MNHQQNIQPIFCPDCQQRRYVEAENQSRPQTQHTADAVQRSADTAQGSVAPQDTYVDLIDTIENLRQEVRAWRNRTKES